MSGRNFTAANGYRYGFNGIEKDDEVKGSGNSYFTDNRVLDVRLGRWLSLDPINRTDISRYAVMSNMPTIRIDPKGDDDYYSEKGKYLYTDTKTSTDIRIIKQDAFNVINNHFSVAIADVKSSNMQLLKVLDANSKVVKNNVTGDALNSLWKDSKPEKSNSGERTEMAAVIVLNLEDADKPSIDLIREDCSQNTNDCSTNPDLNPKSGKPLQIIIGQIHTEPNKDGTPVIDQPGKTYSTVADPKSGDAGVAKSFKKPVYSIGYTKDNTDLEIDKNDPNGKSTNSYMDFDAVKAGASNVGKDALETTGGKPK